MRAGTHWLEQDTSPRYLAAMDPKVIHSETFQTTFDGELYREKSCAYPGLAEPNEPNPLSRDD